MWSVGVPVICPVVELNDRPSGSSVKSLPDASAAISDALRVRCQTANSSMDPFQYAKLDEEYD